MTQLADTHPSVVVIDQPLGGLFEDRGGQGRGPSGEIPDFRALGHYELSFDYFTRVVRFLEGAEEQCGYLYSRSASSRRKTMDNEMDNSSEYRRVEDVDILFPKDEGGKTSEF